MHCKGIAARLQPVFLDLSPNRPSWKATSVRRTISTSCTIFGHYEQLGLPERAPYRPRFRPHAVSSCPPFSIWAHGRVQVTIRWAPASPGPVVTHRLSMEFRDRRPCYSSWDHALKLRSRKKSRFLWQQGSHKPRPLSAGGSPRSSALVTLDQDHTCWASRTLDFASRADKAVSCCKVSKS